ncbi:hypothetical protein FOL47_010128 [Perkinsus chesapeaki]|uniref:Uncharacterized protein n=1 Tax=Perkinsus chesapeaki TaxID=330153 RepID=A0A7J6MQ66_PERCH|nr:hypothetical protein FOL47_010128 [Perkinsus chesapeaki]
MSMATLVGIFFALLLSCGLLTGAAKGCGGDPKPPKWPVKFGKYQGEREGVKYAMEIFELSGSALTFSTKLIFSNATESASAAQCLSCAFRYNSIYHQYHSLEKEGYCDCLQTVLHYVNIWNNTAGVAVFAIDEEVKSIWLYLGYTVMLNATAWI